MNVNEKLNKANSVKALYDNLSNRSNGFCTEIYLEKTDACIISIIIFIFIHLKNQTIEQFNTIERFKKLIDDPVCK